MPYPLHDGGAYSIYHTALGLILQRADLKILALNTPKNWIDSSCIESNFREKARFEYSVIDTRFKPFNAFLNLFTDRSYFVERFYSEQFNTDLIRILNNEDFDIVQLEHLYMCLYFETIRKHSKAKIILRSQNVENNVWNRFLENKGNFFKNIYLRIATNRLEKFEKEMAAKIDGIIAISDNDANTFRTYAPTTPVVSVPIGFDFSKISSYDSKKQYVNFPVFYHLGSMDWMPNVQGIKWFIEEVIPVIRNDSPEFVLRIAGKKMPQWLLDLNCKNLIVDGEVPDSLKYHEDKAIMIVPLLSGSGIRAKIIEGMALGKTIISTTIGAEGIPFTDQENILIADTMEEFVVQIKKCVNSIEFCMEIGKKAQLLALEYYDCKITAGKMMQFYEGLLRLKN